MALALDKRTTLQAVSTSDVFQNYWPAGFTKLSRHTESYKSHNTRAFYHQSSKARFAAPHPDAPPFHGIKVFWPSQFYISKISVATALSKTRSLTTYSLKFHTHVADENHQVVVMKNANGLIQVQAEGPSPAKICFKILEEMSATLSGWCHVKGTASVLFFCIQSQNQPELFPEIKLYQVSPTTCGFSHPATWYTTLLTLRSSVLSHIWVPTAGHTRTPTDATLSLARTSLYNQRRGFVSRHIQRGK